MKNTAESVAIATIMVSFYEWSRLDYDNATFIYICPFNTTIRLMYRAQ